MSSYSRAASNARLRQLDSLRGIAALFVVFSHYAQLVPEQVRHAVDQAGILTWSAWVSPWFWLRYTPLRLVVDGEAAVDLFFVLSGFVLALPLSQDRQPEFWPFVARRLCRIYIPFTIVILIIVAAYAVMPAAPYPWAAGSLNGGVLPYPGYSLSAHLLMTGGDTRLDPPMWTLIHEVRMAAILPAIFLFIRKIGAAQTVAACLPVSVLASFGMIDSISGSWQATLHFLWMFAVGSALAFCRFGRLARPRNAKLSFCLWILAIGLLIAPFDRVWSDFLIGGGAALLIVLCLSESRVTRILVSPIPLWLGRVSFSLYLIHLPILVIALTRGFFGRAAIAAFFLTLVLAELAYRTVEAPAHKLGILLSQVARNKRRPA